MSFNNRTNILLTSEINVKCLLKTAVTFMVVYAILETLPYVVSLFESSSVLNKTGAYSANSTTQKHSAEIQKLDMC